MKCKIILSFICLTTAVYFSCKKNNLNVPAVGLVDESTIANQKGVEGLLIGAYSLLDGAALDNSYFSAFAWGASGSNWIYGSICGTEAHKGSTWFSNPDQPDIRALEIFGPTPNNTMLAARWGALYAGVARSNEVLRVMKKATDISPADQSRIAAEARFLRGFYHFELTKIFRKVPYVDESVTYDAGNYYLPNDTLIWPAIENDFSFAMQNLSAKMNAAGRANKYAAEAYLAKAYLFQQKYNEAKPLLDELISQGTTASGAPYALNPHYADNFNAQTKNSPEAVFSAQMSVNDGSGGWNGNVGDILNFPNAPNAPGQCCGFFQPSQYLVNHFKTDPVTGLPDLDHFDDVNVKNDMGVSAADAFTPYAGTLDPRLDWTVGRRGIPYLDWGLHPGSSEEAGWVRESSSAGPYSPIKNVYYKYQQDHFSDVSFWTTGSTANNINLIRFSDILLWAAEVELRIGSLDKAEAYVNMVRNRMADHPDGWVHTYVDNNDPSKGFTDTPAANYFIRPYPPYYFSNNGQEVALKAVQYERMLELGMEGHRFFDLVRWGIAKTEIDEYIEKESNLSTGVSNYFNHAVFAINKNECFPIPQTQIDLSKGPDGKAKLKQNPGY